MAEEGLTREELERKLADFKAMKKDAEDEKSFVTRQSGLHVTGGEIARYDRDIEKYQRKVEEIEAQLAKL